MNKTGNEDCSTKGPAETCNGGLPNNRSFQVAFVANRKTWNGSFLSSVPSDWSEAVLAGADVGPDESETNMKPQTIMALPCEKQ